MAFVKRWWWSGPLGGLLGLAPGRRLRGDRSHRAEAVSKHRHGEEAMRHREIRREDVQRRSEVGVDHAGQRRSIFDAVRESACLGDDFFAAELVGVSRVLVPVQGVAQCEGDRAYEPELVDLDQFVRRGLDEAGRELLFEEVRDRVTGTVPCGHGLECGHESGQEGVESGLGHWVLPFCRGLLFVRPTKSL